MYLSFNTRAVGLGSLSSDLTIEIAADAGFGGVDLMVRDLLQSGDDPKRIRSRMDERGLRGGAFPCPVDWRIDESTFQRDLKALPRLAEAARTLGLTRTGTWVMPEMPDHPVGRSEVAELHVRRLGAIARILDDHGIQLGLEVIGVESSRTGRRAPFVAKLADLDRELGAIWNETPNLGILLDVFHLYAADEPIESGLAWGIDRVVWVHVADLPPTAKADRSRMIDANRGLPGENGAVDVPKFLSRLAREGYKGPVTAEPLGNCQSIQNQNHWEVASRVKRSLESVWPRDGLAGNIEN